MSSKRPSAKKNTVSPRMGKKQQRSILSFFSKSTSRPDATPTSTKIVSTKTSPVSALKEPDNYDDGAPLGKVAGTERARNSLASGSSRRSLAKEKSTAVCRELFNENAGKRALPVDDDNPISAIPSPIKKPRRSLRSSQSDDEHCGDEPRPDRSHKTNKLRRIMRVAESDDDDDEEQDATFIILDGDDANLSSSQVSTDAISVAENGGCGKRFLDSLSRAVKMDVDGNGYASVVEVAPGNARRAAKKKLAGLDMSGGTVREQKREFGDAHPWAVDIRDSKRRRPGEEGYDKTTLYIPDKVFRLSKKQGGLSPFQQQFWKIKKNNYDVLIFFKLGKFYELYDVDAEIGHKVLGLTYTNGSDMRCCGVPEARFDRHISRLLEHGYKVGRVEQTETANAAANRKAAHKGGNTLKVCQRSLVRILTKATVTDESILRDHRPRYVLSVLESESSDSDAMDESEKQASGCKVGVCYVDAASGDIAIREYVDDFRRSETERLFACLRPQEIIIDRTALSARVSKLVEWTANRHSGDIIDNFENGFPDMTEESIAGYISSTRASEKYKALCAYVAERKLGSKAFGAMTSYLKSLIVDKEILSQGNYNLFPVVDGALLSGTEDIKLCDARGEESSTLVSREVEPFAQNDLSPGRNKVRLDAASMAALEVISSTLNGSERGSLLSFIDRAATPGGRRLLKKWISAPLSCSAYINDRLNAVDALIRLDQKMGSESVSGISKQLSTGKDLERALSRLHQQSVVDSSAVMFDNTNKRKVKEFVKILRSLQSVLFAVEAARDALSSVNCDSKRLNWLVQKGGGIPAEATTLLQHFLGDAFDVAVAENDGDIIPEVGAVPEYDAKKNAITEVEIKLEKELEKWQSALKDDSIRFFHRHRDAYQLEVSVSTLARRGVPSEFEITSETKKVRRFYTRRIQGLLKEHTTVTEAFENAAQNIVRQIVSQFDSHYEIWSAISKASAELDALMGLSKASLGDGIGPMCRPEVLPNDYPQPVFEAKALRHPVLSASSDSFVPNDVSLGDTDSPRIAVLTGPNAGGKSTLSRQVAVCALLAQVGSFVPAESLRFRPFEDIFVRMGAGDDVSRGISTFMMEMEDVSNILNNATSASLLLLDEVGRGTSTFDGYAIAFATLKHLAMHTKAISIFSTHYTMLGQDIATECDEEASRNIGVYEMAADVDETLKKVTFLYKFQKGISGHSRGICCARLAGIPAAIADAADIAASQFEKNLSERLNAASFQIAVKAFNRDGNALVNALQ